MQNDETNEQQQFQFIQELEQQGYAVAILTQSTAQQTCDWDDDNHIYRERAHKGNEAREAGSARFMAAISRKLAHATDLSHLEFRILGHLAWRAGAKNLAWPGYESIADNCATHKTSVIRAIKELEQKGYLRKMPGGGARNTNSYLLTIPVGPKKRSHEDTETSKRSHEDTPSGHMRTPELGKGTRKSSMKGPEPENGELFASSDVEISATKPADLFALTLPEHLQTTDAMIALGRFERDRRERGKKMTTAAIRLLCRKIEKEGWTAAEIVEAADTAIERGWTGMFKPKPKAQENAAQEQSGTTQKDFSGWNRSGEKK